MDFDDYDAVDMVMQQREHYVCGHKVKVELALPLINDTLYDCPGATEVTSETWEEQVQRKLQYAIPDQGQSHSIFKVLCVFASVLLNVSHCPISTMI